MPAVVLGALHKFEATVSDPAMMLPSLQNTITVLRVTALYECTVVVVVDISEQVDVLPVPVKCFGLADTETPWKFMAQGKPGFLALSTPSSTAR